MKQNTLGQVLDSIYLIPVILDHLEEPTVTTTMILQQNSITVYDLEEFKKIKSMLQYHVHAVQNNYAGNYPLLQKGLAEYYDSYLSQMFENIGIAHKRWVILDYGCGSGIVGEQFLSDNPNSSVFFMDKEDYTNGIGLNKKVDFEKEPGWYVDYYAHFDAIIMSELLHCKKKEGQEYLIRSSYEMLKPGGILIIVENVDYCMAYRISKIKHEEHDIVDLEQIDALTKKMFRIEQIKQIQRHKIYELKKIH